ncbi:hypothetical protein Sta7437_0663 [Stanieria cyanosphaera PCC 7437]|uniref:MSMEG_0570 family protein n=1 Tax=Stanieria cyanosphaera (strain ATCC 29371 / PCC 7437) TaxID=111780 RepID=K9XP03_STAC7|nr:MSMEG_0570 family nitrogen starvation response protein [Stanieria cyanosphaera]AFZ34258.1 hypothetical protein Sta7437_0663 [Stanieria cyanosphaera PCC 7437]
MPEIKFLIEWPDGSRQTCYSPSLVVKKYFTPGEEYDLEDFLNRSETALQTASDRFFEAYGFSCSRAWGQFQDIKTQAAQYKNLDNPKVRFLQFQEAQN